MTQNDGSAKGPVPGLAPDGALLSGDDAFLAGFFTAARSSAPDPGSALMARILEAGLAEQAAIAAARNQSARSLVTTGADATRPAGFGAWLAGLGGWGAATGLASAAVAGVWLGFSPPSGLAGIADGVLGTSLAGAGETIDQIDLLPTFDTYLTEG